MKLLKLFQIVFKKALTFKGFFSPGHWEQLFSIIFHYSAITELYLVQFRVILGFQTQIKQNSPPWVILNKPSIPNFFSPLTITFLDIVETRLSQKLIHLLSL